MQDMLEDFKAERATLVGLSPQLPSFNKKVVDAHDLGFDILSDPGNAYAAELGIRFTVPENISAIYRGFGINLPEANGDDSWTLPMPGRVIVSGDGIVRHTDFDPDYTMRPEPYSTIEELKGLSR